MTKSIIPPYIIANYNTFVKKMEGKIFLRIWDKILRGKH